MTTVAIGIFCKTPASGRSKTRLSPPLQPEECEQISKCFIRDLALTVGTVAAESGDTPVAIYTPVGTETQLRELLTPAFQLLPQDDGEFGRRLAVAAEQLLGAGHRAAILLNSDSPTLPPAILRAAVAALKREEDCVVLGPAIDGGYTLIGVSKSHPPLFDDIPWSTSAVYDRTVARAKEIGVPVVSLPLWYDVDDGETLDVLERELNGAALPFAIAGLVGGEAAATRQFMAQRALRHPRQ
jgi:uncharacterized protein